jgi:hypothetical protein
MGFLSFSYSFVSIIFFCGSLLYDMGGRGPLSVLVLAAWGLCSSLHYVLSAGLGVLGFLWIVVTSFFVCVLHLLLSLSLFLLL